SEARVVAAAHAGWRGTKAGVIEAAVAAMERLGAARSRIHAAVGPCIGQSAYEVGSEFEAEFLSRDAANARFFLRSQPDARPHFDLPGYAAHRLTALGLAAVERQSPCTCRGESLFFSYRRAALRGESDYGRQISAIVVA
ncbi:MAG: polyphenol oxidase family protein, partial [Hyphomicrobiaceae bacterium]